MGAGEELRSVFKAMILDEKDKFVEGTVESLNPLQVKPEGSSAGLKGIYWNADIVEGLVEGDRVFMYFNKERKRYYALMKLA